MRKILILEDSEIDMRLLEACLGKDFELSFCNHANKFIGMAAKLSPDLILLDLSLPDGDGLSVCNSIRNHETLSKVPIFIVSGETSLDKKLLGLGLGADDFLTKPFIAQELKLKVHNRLKRIGEVEAQKNFVRKGPFEIDLLKQSVKLDVKSSIKRIELTGTEFKLLCYFIKHEGQVVSRDNLLSAIWGTELNVTDRTIDSHIFMLRKKCQPYSKFFKAVYGEGYRFEVDGV